MPESIAAQVAALQDQLAAHAPAEALRPFAEEQAALAVTPVPAAVPAPGSPLPDADLLDGHGEPTTLAAARGGAPAVLVFYRGAWCPYCNLTLRTYEERVRPALDARGVRLLAVSPQRPDGSLTTAETNALTFTVLSDPGNKLAAALGILTDVRPGGERGAARARHRRRGGERGRHGGDPHADDRRPRRRRGRAVDRRAPRLHDAHGAGGAGGGGGPAPRGRVGLTWRGSRVGRRRGGAPHRVTQRGAVVHGSKPAARRPSSATRRVSGSARSTPKRS
ncbi:peroxiredoxin-like family protein, partial [Streptomyces sp. SolWspMP-sol7th]|uniref:peroxiredoxin-like family protein n=1 Tax=Streptomyces sp. SolWspMP-sol7th TaxID=1839776 RepID=UPI0034A0C77B